MCLRGASVCVREDMWLSLAVAADIGISRCVLQVHYAGKVSQLLGSIDVQLLFFCLRA